ncbi:MAG TPA: sulfatase-like hydrolase/transferase [Labilithrix sp.]|nr:sulfatase-like hydrolase/transferase [Labilithrix sp.]
MSTDARPAPRLAFAADVGMILLAWILLLGLENLVVGVGWREQFVGSWEMAHARYHLSPIAIATGLPLAVVAAGLGRLVAARQVRAGAALGAALGAAVGAGVSSGRHFASLALRVPFVLVVAGAAGVIAAVVVRRAPLDRPRSLAAAGALLAVTAWLADAFLLARLYPAFHAALLGLLLAGAAATTLALRGQPAWRPLAFGALLVGLVSALLAPRSAHAITGDDNLRRVLVEHAPLLGRAVLVASRLAPPPPIEDDGAEASSAAALVHPERSTRALDWTGRDLVVITIDALRADHLSSYGYGRPTTPNIDRLAARGARFEHAYCPTPHTSYSVTSMMTGKYMRPLLALDTGTDSETWAGYLRRYGFRTAAFYPPAVFFIDEHRFRRMKEQGLGFEYRKEEFAAPELRREQIASYVAAAPADKPLFLWVHLFEPHEPYVFHPEHSFGGREGIDAYDSEIATADAEVGAIVEVVEKRRSGAIFVVSADHGEEFGDHGGRYHGTTVYEEQVRVPLVVVGPGVAPSVVSTPVQTIDLLPTTLAALDVPQPARVRGRDLGALLAGKAPPGEEGLAFAETDDYTLLARGDERLVCVRKVASCTLFDIRTDPLEKSPIGDRPARVLELRKLTAAIERENGKLEVPALPEALRRGLQGDRDAAEDVAALFDDARVDIRREAARCAFKLRAPAMAPQLRRALAKDEDQEVKRWSALALVRLGEDSTAAEPLLHDASPRLRLGAALALAEQGDGRGEAELIARWETAFVPGAREPGDLEEARELLGALTKIKARAAVPALLRSLEDVRLRPHVAEALGEIGDARALAPLLAAFANERYVDVRPKEARALVRLGAREALLPPLRRFAGVADPMLEAVAVAADLGLLDAAHGGWKLPAGTPPSSSHVDAEVTVAGEGPARLLAIGLGDGPTTGQVDGVPITPQAHGTVWTVELPSAGARVHVELEDVAAFWIVRRSSEIPPPPPREWSPRDAGAESGL